VIGRRPPPRASGGGPDIAQDLPVRTGDDPVIREDQPVRGTHPAAAASIARTAAAERRARSRM